MNNLVTITGPGGVRLTVNKDYASNFQGLLGDLDAAGYALRPGDSGGYNPRNIAGTNTPSLHSYGAAIDLNWNDNARGTAGNMPANIAEIAAKHGLTWGGTWKNPDPMHFEVTGFKRPTAAPAAPDGTPMAPPAMGLTQQQGKPMSFMEDFAARFQNPLTQQGLGLFLAASQGGDLNAGLNAGVDRANSMQQAMLRNWQLQQEQQKLRAVQQALTNLDGVPPALAAIARASGDAGPIMQYLAQANQPITPYQQKQLEMSEQELEIARAKANAKGEDGLEAQAAARGRIAESLGIEPGTPAWQSYVATGKMGRDEALTATDRKQIFEAEDALPAVDATIRTLERAQELNPNVNSGVGASTRGWLGSVLPDLLVPDALSSPDSGRATSEYDQIVRGEAIKNMSETLKGASTDRELQEFVSIIADTNQPVEVRGRALDRLLSIARDRRSTLGRRVDELRSGEYYKPAEPGQGQGRIPPQAQSLIGEAEAAINAGAPVDAVRKRLAEKLQAMGINPAELGF